MAKDDLSGILPFLNGKMLDFDVSGAFGRDLGIDNFKSGRIVFVKDSGIRLGEAEVGENGT